MLVLAIITISAVFIYLLYPVWLGLLKENVCTESTNRDMENISLIYLSQNGGKFIEKKIQFLLTEITVFKNYEIIVIDDNSSDNSLMILNSFNDKNIRIIHNSETKGIPNSMNTGIKTAQYNNIIFCDQRQSIDPGIIKKLIEPLKYSQIGIVSACISNYDKNNYYSILRAHENFIKQKESKTGNLIGVYGPLYSLKKECYSIIPDNIILDDLYLTLKILPDYQAIFLEDCQIFDESVEFLYNYNRARRYLKGFFQLFSKKILTNLSPKQIVMLIWHKYFRLLISLLFTLCFILLALNSFVNINSLIFFSSLLLIFFVLHLIRFKLIKKYPLKSFILINLFYSVAFFELVLTKLLFIKHYKS